MKQAIVKWVEGLKFVGTANSNHAIVMDGPASAGGQESAVRPGELVLLALAGCTGMDVVSLLKKMRVEFDSLEIGVEAEAAEAYPKTYTRINVEFRIHGRNVPEDKLQKAIELSRETYCSVGAQLQASAEINYRYRILPP
jgi:putative redox protein